MGRHFLAKTVLESFLHPTVSIYCYSQIGSKAATKNKSNEPPFFSCNICNFAFNDRKKREKCITTFYVQLKVWCNHNHLNICHLRHSIISMSGVNIPTRHPMFQTSCVTRQIMRAIYIFRSFLGGSGTWETDIWLNAAAIRIQAGQHLCLAEAGQHTDRQTLQLIDWIGPRAKTVQNICIPFKLKH